MAVRTTIVAFKSLEQKAVNKIGMRKRMKRVIKAGALAYLLIASQLCAFADQNADKSIVVSLPSEPNHFVKLRPFMPNRVLPTRAQLQALQEEKAQIAKEAQHQSALSGQVSEFTQSESDSSSCSTPIHNGKQHKNHRPSTAATPAIVNTAAGKFCLPYIEKSAAEKFSFLRMAEQHLSSDASVKMPPSNNQFFDSTTAANQYPALPAQPMNQPMALSVNPVASTPLDTSGFGSAGPPPFPLCLLPAPALKQLIRTMAYSSCAHSNSGIQSSFGSWHNNFTFSPEIPPSPSSPMGSFRLYSNMTYNGGVNKSHATHITTSTHRNKRKAAAQTTKPRSNSYTATYPPYPTYSYQSTP